MCVHTRCASMCLSVFPAKVKGSDTAGATLSAALVRGIGEGGMIWVWWGMGVSGCTGPSAAFRASCMYVCVTCGCGVCVECVWAASMAAVSCPVARHVSGASVSADGGPASQLLCLALGL